MFQHFENSRTYLLGDPELNVLGTRERLAQWRYRNYGPAWIKIGRKVAYHGSDLNSWMAAQRIVPHMGK